MSDDWYARMYEQVHGRPPVRVRVQTTLREMALMGQESPLFHALRASYAESDPLFRIRMAQMMDQEA